MSLFSGFLTEPLYAMFQQYDEALSPIAETHEIAEVWGLFEDGTVLIKDDRTTPVSLRYVRPIYSDPILFFSREEAGQAYEQVEVAE